MKDGTNRRFEGPAGPRYAAELVQAITADVRKKAIARGDRSGRPESTRSLNHPILLVALVAILGLVIFSNHSLVGEEDWSVVEYRSGEDLAPFRAAFDALLVPVEESL